MRELLFIVNPISGTDYPILSVASRFFSEHTIEWHPQITKKPQDAFYFAQQAVEKNVPCVAVYGGDGTVMEVAQALTHSSIPLHIIPGGTANVVSRELGIPQQTEEALQLLKPENHVIRKIDTMNHEGTPYFIRINVGFFAQIVHETARQAKNSFGSLAYVATALKSSMKPEIIEYSLHIDDQEYVYPAAGLMITNVGNMGLTGLSLHPKIKPNDTLLDVIILTEANLGSLSDLTLSALLQKKSDSVIHHQGKNITVAMQKSQTVVFDDKSVETDYITITIEPRSLSVVVPKL